MEILKVKRRTLHPDAEGELYLYDVMKWTRNDVGGEFYSWWATSTDEKAAYNFMEYLKSKMDENGKFFDEDDAYEAMDVARKLPKNQRYRRYCKATGRLCL